MIRLKETDWNAPGGATEVEVEYPEQPVQDIVNWLRRTPAWKENPQLVEQRVRRLNQQLADYRDDVAKGKAEPPTASPLAEQLKDPVFRASVEVELKKLQQATAASNRRAALERARAAKREKAEAAK